MGKFTSLLGPAVIAVKKICITTYNNYSGTIDNFSADLTTYNPEAITLAIAKGADVNEKDSSGETALHQTARSGNLSFAQSLLAQGADIEARDQKGRTALHIAASWGKIDVVTLLLNKGAQINAQDNNSDTVLILAKLHCRTRIVELLKAQKPPESWVEDETRRAAQPKKLELC